MDEKHNNVVKSTQEVEHEADNQSAPPVFNYLFLYEVYEATQVDCSPAEYTEPPGTWVAWVIGCHRIVRHILLLCQSKSEIQ